MNILIIFFLADILRNTLGMTGVRIRIYGQFFENIFKEFLSTTTIFFFSFSHFVNCSTQN